MFAEDGLETDVDIEYCIVSLTNIVSKQFSDAPLHHLIITGAHWDWPQFSWYGLLDAFPMLETIRIEEYVCCQREHSFLNALSSRSEAGLMVCPNLRRFHIGGRWSLDLTEQVTRCFALRAQQVSKLEALVFASTCTLAFPADDQARIALYRELFVGAKTVEIHTGSSVACLKEDSDVIAMGSMPSAFKGKVRGLSTSGIVDVLFLPL